MLTIMQNVLRVVTWLDRPAILSGHSMGGIAVQKTAEKVNLKALILLASVRSGQLSVIHESLPTDKTLMYSPEQARKMWLYKIDDQSFNAIYYQLISESVSVMNHYSSGDLRINLSKIRYHIFVIGAEYDQTVIHNF